MSISQAEAAMETVISPLLPVCFGASCPSDHAPTPGLGVFILGRFPERSCHKSPYCLSHLLIPYAIDQGV